MISAVILFVTLFGLNQVIFSGFQKKHSFFSTSLMHKLYWYHLFFVGVYYTYALFNNSDSKKYYLRPQDESMGWLDHFGTSTTFVDFFSYPFINGLFLSYEAMMLLYGYLGFLGFVFSYLFFRENIPIKIKVFKRFDFLLLLLFLPNMHFWTASLGKGAPIFLGLMMFAYAIKKPNRRVFLLILSSLIIYFIRPHVFLFVAAGTVLGYMSGREKIQLWKKILVFGIMIGGVIAVQDQILGMANLEGSDDLVSDFEDFSEGRADSLAKKGSGVDMSNYSLPFKLFTFWFRPLFIDAPGILGLITSVENLIYLLLFGKIFQKGFIKFIRNSPVAVKMSIVIFLLSSFALTFVMSNLGIIMRQKSQVMYFAFFVIYYFVAQKKYDRIIARRKKAAKLRQLSEIQTNI